jgi:hypothetical protein
MGEKGVCRQNKVESKQVLVLKMKDKKFGWVFMLGGKII